MEEKEREESNNEEIDAKQNTKNIPFNTNLLMYFDIAVYSWKSIQVIVNPSPQQRQTKYQFTNVFWHCIIFIIINTNHCKYFSTGEH